METKSLGFIGGGRITKIFLQAFKNKSVNFKSIIVCDTNHEVREALKKQFPAIVVTESYVLVAKQDIVFIALHPPVIMETLDKIKEVVSEKTFIISLAPKITINKIASRVATKNIVRMIPNATSYINKGYNPVCYSTSISAQSKQELLDLFNILGSTFETVESKLEGYAIVSAMLPTYFWFQWMELQKISAQIGLNEKEGEEAIMETLRAAIELFYNSGLDSDEVLDLIPIKPIADHEATIKECLSGNLLTLFERIKP